MTARLVHLSVCLGYRGKRVAVIVSAESWQMAEAMAESMPNRFGYCGNASWDEAIERCKAMENDSPGAWGILPEAVQS